MKKTKTNEPESDVTENELESSDEQRTSKRRVWSNNDDMLIRKRAHENADVSDIAKEFDVVYHVMRNRMIKLGVLTPKSGTKRAADKADATAPSRITVSCTTAQMAKALREGALDVHITFKIVD